MSFGKAERFEKQVVCGPPPTAYDPKLPAGSAPGSFPKGDRFLTPNGHEPQTITRSHSSNSVGSTDSSATTRSQTGKGKDHAQCNKQIADLEKELRNITLERNQLLRRRNHPIKASSQGAGSLKENNERPADLENSAEVAALTQTIEELTTQLTEARNLKDELDKLKDERDNALAILEEKQMQVSKVEVQIEELKSSFQQQESALRSELEDALKQASEAKQQLEIQISELEQKLQALETDRLKLLKETEETKAAQDNAMKEVLSRHEDEMKNIITTHAEQVKSLENNLQQLAAEHDAESEQIKFDVARQTDELNQKHSTAIAALKEEHSSQLELVRAEHLEQMNVMQAAKDQLETEKSRLSHKLEEVTLSLETKLDEVETLKTELEVAKEKMETSCAQAEQRFAAMKNSLELDIAECKARYEEQLRSEEEALRTRYENELALVQQSNAQLTDMLQERQDEVKELELLRETARSQHEEQLKQLEKNNQSEREILLWQMHQQRENLEQDLRAEFSRSLNEKETEFQNMNAEWETKMNKAVEEHEAVVTDLQSSHSTQLDNYRQLHEAALANLEKEKDGIVQERDNLAKILAEKEEEMKKVEDEMKLTILKLQFELEALRESNNALVSDLLRVEQEVQQTQERTETEIIELKNQAEEEKKTLIHSHEAVVASMKADADQKAQQVAQLAEQLSTTEESSRLRLAEKEAVLEELKAARDAQIEQLKTQHQDQVDQLRCHYEQMIAEKEEAFARDRETLLVAHTAALDELKKLSEAESTRMQEEFRVAFGNLEEKLAGEKAQLTASYEEKLSLANQHQQAVVEELNRNYEEAADNAQELQQSLDNLRSEFQAALAAAEDKETRHRSEIEQMSSTIQTKEEELKKLKENLSLREKQTADEWIQRETALMTQCSAQNQQTVADYEARLASLVSELQTARENARQAKTERDAAQEEVSILQIQNEAQMAALHEQYDQERSMLLEKLSEQREEISKIHASELAALKAKLAQSERSLETERQESARRLSEAELTSQAAVRAVLEPVTAELEALRRDRENYLALQKVYQELQARIEPFKEQLEMFEAEKKALLSQAQNAESTMAALAAKYTQLLGHTNSKQKIHHLDKLKQDIFQLRKELGEKNLALEKEKKARQKAEDRIKELTGRKKFDPAEAFKVPETAPVPPANKVVKPNAPKTAPTATGSAPAPAAPAAPAPPKERKPLRSQPTSFGQQSTGFFLSFDDIEKTRTEMEKDRQRRLEARRQASHNFDAFEVEFSDSESNMRRETFDIPSKQQLDATHTLENKENGHSFAHDISCIPTTEEEAAKEKRLQQLQGVRSSTPLAQRRPIDN